MEAQRPSQPAIKGQADEKDEMDLTAILDDGQRADLTLLVANLTESMRKLILDNFDSMAGLDKTLLREGLTDDEKMMLADPANADVAAYDRERKLKIESDKDLATLKMKNLKKHALKAFDEWREQVIQRVGQVVNSERTAQEQVQKTAGKADTSKPQAPSTVGRVMEAPSRIINLKFRDLFPPTRTSLTKMPMDKRTLVLHSLLLLLLSLEHYNAYSRILLLNLTSSLKLPLRTFEQDEYTTAKGLLEAAKELTADEERMKKIEANKESRKWKVGLATAAGAAIIGVTGGMAAPLVAAGVGSVMGGLGLGTTAAAAYLGSVAGSTVLVGGLFGAYGGRMTGQMMDSYAREVEDFQFLPVHSSSDKKTSEDEAKGAQEASDHDHKLRVTIGISGWLTEKEEVVKPWWSLGTGAEVFALKYELEALLNLGNAMNGMVQSAAWGYAQKEIISRTIFADLAAALWPIGLLKVARVIDNPFSVAKSRADKAGEVLADALINRAQGERPVTLIGYSLGARVIYTCLMSLAKRKEFGIIENAVMIGSPTPSDTSDWRVLRSVVAGRLVNVFSVNDYVLGFMYRTSAIQYGVAGLQKVEGLSSVENFDVSEDVSSHQRYRYLIGAILKKIGFEDIDMAAVEEEHKQLLKMEEEERKQAEASKQRWLMRRESTGGKKDEAAEGEAEAKELEKKVQEQTEKSLTTRVIEYFYTPAVPDPKDINKSTGNLQKAPKDPNQTAKDAKSSTEGYAAYLYQSLPSMPYVSKSTPGSSVQKSAPADPTKATGQATKAADGKTGQPQSYVQQATSYLPSLPSMPSLSGSGKAKSDPKSAAEKATDASTKAATTTTSAAKGTAGIVSDTVTPTVKNTLNPKDNPAVKSSKRAADKAPIIHQAKDRTPAPVKKAGGEVAGAVGTTVQNTGQTVQKGLDTTTGKATEGGKAATDGGRKAAQTGQSYTSRAAAYLPAMPSVSLPMLGFGGGGASKKPAPPKLQKKASSKTETKVPSGTQATDTARPKLEKAPSSSTGIKSPRPPKLDKLPSGVKSPPPAKLERLPSGVKSPSALSGMKSPLSSVAGATTSAPPKLERLPSGAKSPPTSVPTPSLVRQISGVRSPPPKLGPRRTSSQQGGVGVKSPSSGVNVAAPAPPTPAAIGERLASIPSAAAPKKSNNPTNGVKSPAQSGKEKEKEAPLAAETIKASGPTPSAPGSGVARKAGEVGKTAAQTGGGILSGMGRAVGLGGTAGGSER